MLRVVVGCLLAFDIGATSARAAGYDDFAHGMAALNRSDNDAAISDFTTALSTGDLNTSLVPAAYLGRSKAELRKKQCIAAQADVTAAIKLKPDYFDAYLDRGSVDECVGDETAAVSDFTRAIQLGPSWNGYWGRGHARWSSGDFSEAAVDFATAASFHPNYPYVVLWFAMSRLRAGARDNAELAAYVAPLNLGSWPGPIIDLYRGRSNPTDVANAAADGDGKTVIEHRCESNFYTAEWWLAQHNVDAARPLLADARANCPQDYMEFEAAGIELKRIP